MGIKKDNPGSVPQTKYLAFFLNCPLHGAQFTSKSCTLLFTTLVTFVEEKNKHMYHMPSRFDTYIFLKFPLFEIPSWSISCLKLHFQ